MNRKIGISAVINGVCKPAAIVINYLYIPFILKYLGVEKYGLWITILTILSWTDFLDIGIGNGLRNLLTESITLHKGDEKTLVSSAYAFILGLMLCIMIIFSIIVFAIDWNDALKISVKDENILIVMLLSLFFMSSNIVLALCKSLYYAVQMSHITGIMQVSVQTLNFVGMIIAHRFISRSLILTVLVYGFSLILVNLFCSLYLWRLNSDLRPSYNYIRIDTGKRIAVMGIKFWIIQICALILFSTDAVIISVIHGAKEVTPYSIVNRLFNVPIVLFSAVLMPFWSAITRISTEKRNDELRKMISIVRFLTIPFILLAISILLCFKPIVIIWLRQHLVYDSLLLMFGFLYSVLNIWTNANGVIANGLGLLDKQIPMSIIQAVINIPLSCFFSLFLNMGVSGILLGTDLSLLISCVYLPYYINNQIGKA